jgi:hypothetical protein
MPAPPFVRYATPRGQTTASKTDAHFSVVRDIGGELTW